MTAGLQPPNLATDALRALARGGALTFDELAEAIGLTTDDLDFDAVVDELLARDRVVVLRDNALADAVSLLARTTLTHRLDATEAAEGWVPVEVDLTPLGALAGDSLPLAGGGRVSVESGLSARGMPYARLVGPPGWLDGTPAGALVGLRLSDGLLHVEPGAAARDDAAPPRALAEGARRRLDLVASHDEDPRVEIEECLWEGLAADPDALAGVLPPLTELTDRAGLNRRGVHVAEPDATWGDGDEARMGALLAESMYGLDADEAAALQALRDARAAALDDQLDADTVAQAAAGFADPAALETFLSERPPDEAAATAAHAVAERHGGSARAGARVLLARLAEARGETLAAEQLLSDALADDPEHDEALADAAWYAADRGDARRALALLGRAGRADDPEAEMLRRFTGPTATGVGRNDPCPCGSGRKFKRCCGGRDGGPLPSRAGWLAHKVAWFVRRPTQWQRIRPLAHARLPGREPGWRHDALVDPVVVDLAVFDCGLLDDFLAQRGVLLPDDEAELAASWRATRRDVYRVDGQRGERLTLTSVTGGQTAVARGAQAPSLDRGEHLLGRIVPSGGEEPVLFWAPLRLGRPVPPHAERLCDPDTDPVQVAELLAAGRPRLVTTEGQPLLSCEVRYALPAGDGDAVAALACLDVLEQDDDEAGVFRELVEVGGELKVRGTLTVADGELGIDTNADARADRLRTLVEAALPGLRLLSDARTPMWLALEDADRYAIPPEPVEPSADERAFLAEFIREQEERWLDESVPALGGLTPREAADDPEERAHLERLLDDAVGVFDHDRLRRLLGIDAPDAAPHMAGDPAAGTHGASGPWAADGGDADAIARRRFAVPPATGAFDDIDLAFLDPRDDDERGLLIRAEHPELGAALDDERDEVEGPDGEPFNPRLHLVLHEVVANQLWHDEPPEVWETAKRLQAAGYDRHEILHMLAAANADEVWHIQSERQAFDRDRFRAALDALPDSWEAQRDDRPGGPGPRTRGRRLPPGGGHPRR